MYKRQEYNIYREEAGYYGFIGVSSGTTFSDNNYQADTADTPRDDWDPVGDGNNPSVVAFHQQRMVLAGTRDSPQALSLIHILGTGQSRLESAARLGIRFDIAPSLPLADGIDAVRRALPRLWFDSRHCCLLYTSRCV